MSQNSQGLAWTREEVDKELESIMELIHRFSFLFVKTCVCLRIWNHVCMQQVYIYMRIYSTHAHKCVNLQNICCMQTHLYIHEFMKQNFVFKKETYK